MTKRVAGAAAAAVLLAGCGSVRIDDQKTERAIQAATEKLGIAVKTVDCPSDLTAKKGSTFDCSVTAEDGSTGTAVVTEKDAKGNVEYKAPFARPSSLDAGVAGTLAKQGVPGAKVACPDIVEIKKGSKTDCDATSGSDKATVTVTFTDDQGNYSIRVKAQ